LKPRRFPANPGVSAVALERGGQDVAHDRDDAGVGARMRDELAADDERRRIEEVDAEEVALEAVAPVRAHPRDRQAGGHAGDDGVLGA
jgi:hypothetical protein